MRTQISSYERFQRFWKKSFTIEQHKISIRMQDNLKFIFTLSRLFLNAKQSHNN